MKQIAMVIGARPNFIKAAPLLLEARKHPDLHINVIHTGQHYDEQMSRIFLEELNIHRPDVQLDIQGHFHTEKIGKMFSALTSAIQCGEYAAVIVFGDVNSTLAGALAAARNTCPLMHIEAGLRSHDRRMPEEINRVIVDHLADLLFTTEPSANENLALEGIPAERVKYVGNVMIECLERFRPRIEACDIARRLGLHGRAYLMATIHRQENTDSPEMLREILLMLGDAAAQREVVIPLHPGTRRKIDDYKLQHLLAPLNVVEPLGYFEFVKLVADSRGVITDSGGIQEETSHLGVPCATLRDNTERPITLSLGSNKLFGIHRSNVPEIMAHVERTDFQPGTIPLWDKDVSGRIVRCLKQYFVELEADRQTTLQTWPRRRKAA